MTALLVRSEVGEPGAGAVPQGPNLNTQWYHSLFLTSQDARFLGLAGSETESGQSGLQKLGSHKPPRSSRRSLTQSSKHSTNRILRGMGHSHISFSLFYL